MNDTGTIGSPPNGAELQSCVEIEACPDFVIGRGGDIVIVDRRFSRGTTLQLCIKNPESSLTYVDGKITESHALIRPLRGDRDSPRRVAL